MTDDEGRYRFVTIKPGAYPWGNHDNAWRPAHIHFSLFGRAFAQRLVTQMYFPGDPLFVQDPIFNSVRDPAARERHDRALRPRRRPSRSGRSATAWTSCCAGARRRRSEDVMPGDDAVADRRAVLRVRAAVEGGDGCVVARRPGRDPDRRRVLDGDGEPVADALVETWQANRHGRYRHPEDTREELPLGTASRGFGRCPTDAEGRFEIVTVKPGAADGQAPHIDVCVFARGLLRRLVTRIYFPDEAEANAADPLLASIEDPRRARRLVARTLDGVLAFDIHLQGERETAFLDV